MGESQFQPGNSQLTHDIIHTTDNDVYHTFHRSPLTMGSSGIVEAIVNLLLYFRHLSQSIRRIAYYSARDHILDSWVLGNLSYQTAKTLRNHRHWIWYLWYKRIPEYLRYGENYTDSKVASERHWRIVNDNRVQTATETFATQLYRAAIKQIHQLQIALEATIKSYYTRNKVRIDELTQIVQKEIGVAYNKSVAFTKSVRKQLITYVNQTAQQLRTYADQKSSQAETNAVRKSNAFTIAAILALIAGIIAKTIATQEEIAAAEALDAAWIAGEGAALESDLGLFGKELSKIMDVAAIGLMMGYVAAGAEDAYDTGRITAEVLEPILTPIADGVNQVLRIL